MREERDLLGGAFSAIGPPTWAVYLFGADFAAWFASPFALLGVVPSFLKRTDEETEEPTNAQWRAWLERGRPYRHRDDRTSVLTRRSARRALVMCRILSGSRVRQAIRFSMRLKRC
jgi:hypothetical protein